MKKNIFGFLALIFITSVVQGQQLNAGISKRSFKQRLVADVVVMAPEVKHIILYGQTTITGQNHPELYAAAEIPVVNKSRFYLGFDNGLGWSGIQHYGTGTYFTGVTSWIPVIKKYGAYGMYSFIPSQKASTLQIGVFKQIF